MRIGLLATILSIVLINQCFGQLTEQGNVLQPSNVIVGQTVSKDIALSQPTTNAGAKKDTAKRLAPWFVQKFRLSAGLFLSLNNTNVQVSGARVGTDVDFENDLGFNKSSATFLADFQWRSASRSRFDLSYFSLNRSSDHTLEKTINFGNNTYDINSQISTSFSTYIYRLSYGYAILSKPNFEAGLLVGAHVIKASAGITLVGGNINTSVKNDYGVTAPLPDFGIWGGYTISPRWSINGESDFLQLTIGSIFGRILAYNVSTTYKILKNLDATLGFTGLNVKVDAERNNLRGQLKWGYNGPTLSVAYSFGNKSWSSGK